MQRPVRRAHFLYVTAGADMRPANRRGERPARRSSWSTVSALSAAAKYLRLKGAEIYSRQSRHLPVI
ncbi:hypothetical protein GCM10010094_24250 [Streptomyces flaveus]|uniref:Uncharacterized protein n=1 Tax=Streptomyces flaveus TaxID=66370 RepID=A0A917VCH3_9ACTN|nr:hypothetical protein GCM10010094_24250 [Streptomyces flaveus]